MRSLVLIIISVLLGAVGQVLLKLGIKNVQPELSLLGLLKLVVQVFTTPALLLGVACFGSSFLLWLVILSREELSYAYPMVSLGYLVVVIASFYLFKENVTLLRFAGLLMICLGVSVVARS
ncbi:MAG TPA: hypothetical protein VFF14_09470 [Candidatus Deferrimicrobium sp.]|nr:hypothetical protein [Candidatus Deferrimicrobium sp.]